MWSILIVEKETHLQGWGREEGLGAHTHLISISPTVHALCKEPACSYSMPAFIVRVGHVATA